MFASSFLPRLPGATSNALVAGFLGRAGLTIDGPQPWDPQCRHPDWCARLLRGRSLALGESYMDGWWECADLEGFFTRLLRCDLRGHAGRSLPPAVTSLLRNRQSRRRAHRAVRHHYDLGNRFYRRMLGERMMYSCAYWEGAETLDQAQERKLDLVCRKLVLRPGMRLLDVGCGWGGLARWAAERHGVSVVGITLSPAQADYARAACAGLPVDIRLQDYREVGGCFDRIVSIGMLEHVGPANYAAYFAAMRACLEPDGAFLLHTIGGNRSVGASDPWLDRYIFPDSVLPAAAQLTAAAEGRLVIEDWHCLGQHYHPTLLHWLRNCEAAWDGGEAAPDPRFQRMWRYYLLSCAASFRVRRNQVWQVLFTPQGHEGGWPSVR